MGSRDVGSGTAKAEGASQRLAWASTAGGKPDRIQVLLAACGIAGPLLYTSVVLVLGFLRPGYDHATQVVSELGEVGAPNAIVMNATFFLVGVLGIAFGVGLYRGRSGGSWSKVGPALVAIGSVGFIGSSFFPCSPGCAPDTSRSHFTAGAIGTVSVFAPLAFWWSLRGNVRWRGYSSYSLATEFLVVPIAIAGLAGATKPWDGLGQRVWAGFFLLWILLMAVHLLRHSLRAADGDVSAS